MTPEEKALVHYRLERANEALVEAKLLFESGHFHTHVNRPYYACFQAVSALLLTKGLTTNKHTHLRALLHEELIRPGIIPLEYGQFFDLPFNNRQKSDHSDFVVFRTEQIEGWLKQSTEFVNCISSHIPA